MASISNRQFTYGIAAFIVLSVVAFFLGYVVLPLLGRSSLGWVAVAFMLTGLLILIFTLLRLHYADERERQALATRPPVPKKP